MEQDKNRTEALDLFKDLLDTLSDEELKSLYYAFQTALIKLHIKTVDEIKRNKNLSEDEKLKRLMSPLMAFSQPYTQPDQTYPFISESIRIEKELDLKHLVPNASKYRIDLEEGKPLEPSGPVIFLKDEFKRIVDYRNKLIAEGKKPSPVTLNTGYVSLREIHKDWIEKLTPKTMKSHDLLDQVLVDYTIKRAQNGDEKAIQKLYDLYVTAAEGIAVKTATSIGRKFSYHPSKEDINDIKQDTRVLLRFILSGFRPEDILKQLLQGRDGKGFMAIPLWTKNFFIYYLSEYIPQEIRENLKEIRMDEELIGKLINFVAGDEGTREEVADSIDFFKNHIQVLGLERRTLLNLFTPIQNSTFWKGTPKRINRFNNYSFRPGRIKMGPTHNLTTWLFGRRHETIAVATGYPPSGKVYQLLRDKWGPLLKEKSELINFDFTDDYDENHKESIGFKERTKALRTRDSELNKTPKEIVEQLVKMGASQRDAEVFAKCKICGIKQQRLAKQYHISDRWIRSICRKIEIIIDSQ